MKALCLKDGELKLKELPTPVANENEALIKVKLAGICKTDLELVKGYMDFDGVLGHEFVGVVEKAESESWIGKRVCGEINFGCGRCHYCLRGLSRHCPNRTVLGIMNQDGVFAEYVVLPTDNLQEIPKEVPDLTAVFVEPLAAALEILEQVQIEPNASVAVIGDGKLGLLICQVLKLTGCKLLLIGKHANKLGLAESWGIDALNLDQLSNDKYDIVVEASGSPSGFSTAMRLIKPRGTIVLKSTYHGEISLNAAPIVIDEISILGSRCGQFPSAVRLLQEKLVDVESLITEILPFDKALEAFELAQQPDKLKIVLQVHD